MSEKKEFFEFDYEPIRGYPELRWTGKRPFTGTPYYPAQLKESFGDDIDGWRNKLYWGDNLQVMSHLLRNYRGKVNLIYIDPPFDSKADYKKKIELRGKSTTTDSTTFEEKQYDPDRDFSHYLDSSVRNLDYRRSHMHNGQYDMVGVLTAKDKTNPGEGVKVGGVYEDDWTEMVKVYDPAHPDADENGYVTYPNVNIVTEMTNMIDTSRAYEANATAFEASKSMMSRGLEINGN